MCKNGEAKLNSEMGVDGRKKKRRRGCEHKSGGQGGLQKELEKKNKKIKEIMMGISDEIKQKNGTEEIGRNKQPQH